MKQASNSPSPPAYVYTRGIWRPTEKELQRMTPAKGNGPGRPMVYVRGRGSNVRFVLGGKTPLELEDLRPGEPYFASSTSEFRGQGPEIRRTIRIYADPGAKAIASEQELTLDHWARPITLFEALRALRGEFIQLRRKGRGEKNRGGPPDAVWKREDLYLLAHRGRVVHQCEDLGDLQRFADHHDWTHPRKKRRDWELAKGDERA